MKSLQPTVFFLIIALISGCSKGPDADSPLAFAPATTPYVFANLKSIPKPVMESWLALVAPFNQAHGELLAALRADLAELPPAVQALVPLLEVTQGKLSYAGLEEMGLRPDGLGAFYGVGLVPVLRMELGDAGKFRKLVADYEHKRGAALPVDKIEDQAYWRIAGTESGAPALILAIVGEHLVATADLGAKVRRWQICWACTAPSAACATAMSWPNSTTPTISRPTAPSCWTTAAWRARCPARMPKSRPPCCRHRPVRPSWPGWRRRCPVPLPGMRNWKPSACA